jgi:dUTP pyrophosphatase
MQVQLKILENGNEKLIPFYATAQSAGMDLLTANTENIVIQPGTHQLISTGISIALPDGFEAQIRSRSGLAAKFGVCVLNSPGTIDSDYRGEVKVILINLGKEKFIVTPGMRIAQMVISKYQKIEWEIVEELEDTTRGSGGMGSTGLT